MRKGAAEAEGAAEAVAVAPNIPTEKSVLNQLESVIDPEIGHSIVGLGLVYGVTVDTKSRAVNICFTMTSPACPLADHFRQQITKKLAEPFAGWSIAVDMTFDPPWSPDKIHADIQEQLALMGMPVQSHQR